MSKNEDPSRPYFFNARMSTLAGDILSGDPKRAKQVLEAHGVSIATRLGLKQDSKSYIDEQSKLMRSIITARVRTIAVPMPETEQGKKDIFKNVLNLVNLLQNPFYERMIANDRKIYKAALKAAFNTLNKKEIHHFFFNIIQTEKALMEQTVSEIDNISIYNASKSQRPLYALFVNECRQKDSLFPPAFKREFLKLAAEFDQILKEDLESSENQSPQVPEEPEHNYLRVVEVDTLLPDGEAEKIEGIAFGERKHGEESVLRTQPRLSWIIDGLRHSGFELSDMVLYTEKKVEGYNPRVSQYKVLEAQKDGHHFQIAVSEVIGNTTLVIKNPIDFGTDDNVVITVADLKKNDSVFQVNCYTQDQWIRNIRHYALTPLEDLSTQLKTKIHWGNRAEDVRQSFGEFYLETQQLPQTRDNEIIQHGPLAGKTTFQRMYHALKRGIQGLEHVQNFASLRNDVFGPGCENKARVKMEPLAGMAPTPQFDAQKIFKEAVLSIKETGRLPDLGAEFEKSLQAGYVSGLERLVDDASTINTVSKFYVATGLAQETGDGDIVPSTPAVIAQFERFLKL
jgi:hypothetical protein